MAAPRRNEVGMNVSKFTIELYKKVCADSDNIIISPYNIASALMLTALGCAGATKDQILTSLYLKEVNEPHRSYGSLQEDLQLGSHNSTSLSIATKIFPRSGIQLKDSFLQHSKEFYRSTIEALDYSSDPDGARQKINQWVEKQTNEKIIDLIPEGVINNMTINVLATAIYFKGFWEKQFSKSRTFRADFYATPEKKESVQMMVAESKSVFQYAQIDKYSCKILELPYKEQLFSMFLILPYDKVKLADLEGHLSFSMLEELQSQMILEEVILQLPKFKIESSFNLKSTLDSLGITDIFSSERADMSTMFVSTGAERLKPYVSGVIHKAVVEVNEEGTEAAAATAVIVEMTALKPSFTFVANRPFMYFVQDNQTRTILFVGKFSEPEK